MTLEDLVWVDMKRLGTLCAPSIAWKIFNSRTLDSDLEKMFPATVGIILRSFCIPYAELPHKVNDKHPLIKGVVRYRLEVGR